MENPMIQIREFHDGTWSVMARIWNPQKKFYEHPNLVNLTREEAEMYCQEYIENTPSVDYIVDNWECIGD